MQFVDALLADLAIKLDQGVDQFMAPGRFFAGESLQREFLQRRFFFAAGEVFEHRAGGDAGPAAHQFQQLHQQRDAGLAQYREPVGRLDHVGKRRLLQQQGDGGAHQAAPRCRGVAATAAHGRRGARWLGGRRTLADAGEFGQALLHQIQEGAVGNAGDKRLGPFGQARLAFHAGQVHVLGQFVEEELRQRRRLRQARVETGRAFLAHDAVRVLAFGQEQEKRLAAVAHARQHRFERLPGGAAAGAVAVEAEVHVGGIAEQQLGVVGRGRGAQRGDGGVHAVLEKRHHVHVTLDHDQPRDLRVRLAHLPQAVEFPALVEERGLGRVEVLRAVVLFHHPAAEGDDAAPAVVDGEHDAVAELVVDAAGVVAREQADLFQQRQPAFVGAQGGLQAFPAVGRVADGKTRLVLGIDAAPLQVGPGLRAALQLLLEKLRGGVDGEIELARFTRLVALAGVAGHFHAHALGQFLDRVEELEAVVVHQEADRGAVRAAAEAVVELLGRRHRERGRTFVVERTPRRILPPLPLERHARTHHLDDIRPGEQVVDEGVGDAGHGRLGCHGVGCQPARDFLTSWETRPMSALPARRGFRTPISLPMSAGPAALVSALAASMAAWISASDIFAGR